MLQLDVVQAFRFNPLVFGLLPLYAVYWLAAKKQMRGISAPTMAVMLALTVGFGILRNFPAFAWLAPTRLP